MRDPMLMEIPANSLELNKSHQIHIEQLLEAINVDDVVIFDILSQPVQEKYLKVGGIVEIMTRQNPEIAQRYLMGFLIGLEVGSIVFSNQAELSNVVQMVYNRSIGVPKPRGTIPPPPTPASRYAEVNEIINLENCGLELQASLSPVAQRIADTLSDDQGEQHFIRGAFGLGLSVSYMADRLATDAGDWSAALAELDGGNFS